MNTSSAPETQVAQKYLSASDSHRTSRCHYPNLTNWNPMTPPSCFRRLAAVYGIYNTLSPRESRRRQSALPYVWRRVGWEMSGVSSPFELFLPIPSLSTTSSLQRMRRLGPASVSASSLVFVVGGASSARSLSMPEMPARSGDSDSTLDCVPPLVGWCRV